MAKTIWLFVSLMVFITACVPVISNESTKEGTITIATAKSDWRFSYIRPGKDGLLSFCAEPPPDTATENTVSIVTELGLGSLIAQQTAVPGNLSLESTISLSEKIIELADRTQIIEVQRHALYRLCELNVNGALDGAQTVQLYDKLLFTIRLFALSDLVTNLKKDSGADSTVLTLLITIGLSEKQSEVVVTKYMMTKVNSGA